MRAPGIYWTRERDGCEWWIEEWRDGWWFSIGDDTVRSDDDRMEIGPRVTPPGASLTKDEALRWYNAGIDCAYDGQGDVAAARWAAWFENAWAKQPAVARATAITFGEPCGHRCCDESCVSLGARMLEVSNGDDVFGPRWQARLAFNLTMAALLAAAASRPAPGAAT